MKILHVLHQSLPDFAGSSIRSRDIVDSQKLVGIDPVVITSPFQKPQNSLSNPELIRGTKYYRTYKGNTSEEVSEASRGFLVRARKLLRTFRFSYLLYKTAKKEKPDLLHAHSTFFCALSAIIVGRILTLPVVYEVRSLWEQRQLMTDKSLKARMQVKFISMAEKFCMTLAVVVIAINDNLKKALIKRGIDRNKIFVIPNAVSLETIPKVRPSLISKPKSQITFGYIGSISYIEGLDYLIEAFARLKSKGFSNPLLIYGKGIALHDLESLVRRKGIKQVTLMGSVPPDDIQIAYQNIDVIVNPRRRSELTDSVTPLKPLEAMAYYKLVLASDVKGMRELITHGQTGFLCEPDSIDRLASLIEDIITRKTVAELEKIVLQAYSYLKSQRSWTANAQKYRNIYNALTAVQ